MYYCIKDLIDTGFSFNLTQFYFDTPQLPIIAKKLPQVISAFHKSFFNQQILRFLKLDIKVFRMKHKISPTQQFR